MRRFLFTAGIVCAVLQAPVLRAQDVAVPRAADSSVAAQPLRPDGTRLRPRAMLYDMLVTGDSGTQHVGWYTVWIYDVTFAGRPAWEVSDRRESHAPFAVRVTRDSVILGRDDLAPLRWEASAGASRFVTAFSGDSAYGGATGPAARSTFTIAAPAPVVTSEGSLDALLQIAPLGTGWSASASMLVADMAGARLLPLHLAVVREEAVAIPAGQFDAWVVRAAVNGSERLIWIDKATRVVVKTSEVPPHMPGMTVERILVGGR